jgi:hypothetical protein
MPGTDKHTSYLLPDFLSSDHGGRVTPWRSKVQVFIFSVFIGIYATGMRGFPKRNYRVEKGFSPPDSRWIIAGMRAPLPE